MALAIHFEGLLERSVVKDMAELARLGHVTRARRTPIMNLCLLAHHIQEALLDLPKTKQGRHWLQFRTSNRCRSSSVGGDNGRGGRPEARL